MDDALRHTISEMLDDGVWPREVLDLLSAFVAAGGDAGVLDEVVAYVRDDYCGGNLNARHVPAFALRQPSEDDAIA